MQHAARSQSLIDRRANTRRGRADLAVVWIPLALTALPQLFSSHAFAAETYGPLPSGPTAPAAEVTGEPPAQSQEEQNQEAGVAAPSESGTGVQAAIESPDAEMSTAVESGEEPTSLLSRFAMSYYGIFYGPAIEGTSKYQPTQQGINNTDAPILLKNYLFLGYSIDDNLAFGVTGLFDYVPVKVNEQGISWRDPYLRLVNVHLLQSGNFNLLGDLRYHIPVSKGTKPGQVLSRDQDLLGGVETFQVATYQFDNSPFSIGTYASARVNLYGSQGFGNDMEFYLGPNVTYQVTPSLAFVLLYEANAAHVYKDKSFSFVNEGTDLEPGISWNITPRLNVNPYLNLYPSNLTLRSTSMGMTLSFQLL